MPLKAGFILPSSIEYNSSSNFFHKLKSTIMEMKNQETALTTQSSPGFTRRNFIAKTVMSVAGLALTPLLFASSNPATKTVDFSGISLIQDKDKKKTVLLINAH